MFVLAVMPQTAPLSAAPGPAGPVRVIDADTWDVGGQRVRLFGIDAPEKAQICDDAAGRPWRCGRWASHWTRDRFDRRSARCDRIATDGYGRIVARCFVGGADAGRILVQSGIALAYRHYSMDYVGDERIAAADRRGLHAGHLQAPAEFRHARAVATPPPPGGCPIKGNVSATGKRIYHLPGQQFYARTVISTARGERWFCSRAEARLAGWRQALR